MMLTLMLVPPCNPEPGSTTLNSGCAMTTLKFALSVSVPVVKTTRLVCAVVAVTVRLHRALVSLSTWQVFTWMPLPKLNWVPEIGFGSQCVLRPAKETFSVWPGSAVDGGSYQMSGVGGGGAPGEPGAAATRKLPVRTWVPVTTVNAW